MHRRELKEAPALHVENVALIEDDLKELFAELRRVESADVPSDVPFTHLGGDSLTGVLFVRRVNQRYDTNIPPITLLQRDFTVSAFASYLIDNAVNAAPVISDWCAEVDAVWAEHCSFLLDREKDKSGELEQKTYQEGDTYFLTGVTGFLGKHVLMELLLADWLKDKKFLCLVRGKDEADGKARVRAALLEAMSPPHPASYVDDLLARVTVIVGDGEKKFFGLSEEGFATLCTEVIAVYHVASNTNTLLDYHALKPSNVLGAVEAMRVAHVAG